MGRAILGALVGLVFGLFVGIDLVLFGVVDLGSVVVSLCALVGLVGGGVLGFLGRRRAAPSAVDAQ